jgi:hypothetical protein
MFILDIELTDEPGTLEPLLRYWWAKLWARLRPTPQPPAEAEAEIEERDRPAGLILQGRGHTKGV